MKALIFSISGQDGAHLSQFLLNKVYRVFVALIEVNIFPLYEIM
jgi:GDP-D-mannose dehydratase